MSFNLGEIEDQLRVISFGKTLHPITLILSFIFGLFFVFPIIDMWGISFGGVFFILSIWFGFLIQQYIADHLKKKLLDTIEVIGFYSQEIEQKTGTLVGSIERDIAFEGINIYDIDDIQKHFHSLKKSIYLFRKELKVFFIIKLLCFSFGEENTSLNLRNVVKNMDIYLSSMFQRNLEIIRNSLNTWLNNHKVELFNIIGSIERNYASDVTGKGIFDLTIKSLESHISDLEKIKVTL